MVARPATPRQFQPRGVVARKFCLLRQLAVGGMGEVWVARNESTGAEVALKVLRPGGPAEPDAEARFRHEARLGAMLSHRNIVRIFDLVEEPDGTRVLVMELLRGETLKTHLERKGPRSMDEALAIAAPVLSALQHAHDMGVVHRDVTPANIFLAIDPDGQITPKIVDFGIAKIPGGPVELKTLDGRALGTPRYMSPEQIRSQGELDGRSDLFSMGVVLYELMTGTSPFAADTPAASLALVLECPVDPDPAIDPRLWIELQRALAKRPYERHASAQEMATALLEAAGQGGVASRLGFLRTDPPPRSSEDVAPPMEAADLPIDEPSKSIEEHSVVLTISKKNLTSAAWAVGGVLVGAALVSVLLLAASGRSESSEAKTSASPIASVAPPAAMPEVPHAPDPIQPSAPPPEASASAAASPARGAGSTPRPRPGPSRKEKSPMPAKPLPGATKAIATTPGF